MSLAKATKQLSDDDLITCGICHIEMEHPRSLICLHTCCLGCLREWSKHSKTVVICPLCRKPTPLPPDGVDGLRSYVFVTKLKDRKAVSRQLMDKNVKIACTSCDVSDSNEAVARCLECDDFLCDSCRKAHKTLRSTKNHSLFTLVELRSGKISLLKKSEEDHCKEHVGQTLWLYCKVCDVPICTGCTVLEHPKGSHKLVKINDAITGQREKIQKLAGSCNVKKEEVDNAFERIKQMRQDLASNQCAVNLAIDEKKEKVKRSILVSLETQADDLKTPVAEMMSLKEKAAAVHEDELNIMNSRLKIALDMASLVTKEGSDSDVASVYKHLTTTLHQLEQVTIPFIELGSLRFVEKSSVKMSESIGKIEEDTEISHSTPDRSIRMRNTKQWNAPWMMVRKCGDSSKNVKGKLRDGKGVAINQKGDVAVADWGASKVYIYDKDGGDLKMSIDTQQGLHSNPGGYGSYPHGVVVYQGEYIVTDQTDSPTVYDSKGRYIRQVVGTDKDSRRGIAVNSHGHVLVGHDSEKSLEIYSYIDGKQITSLDIPILAKYIGVSQSDDNIVITDDFAAAQVVDSQGQTIHVLRPPVDVTSFWCPSGVCTIGEGDNEEIFICNSDGPPGVYRFSLTTGKYLGCVTTEVSGPQGIAFIENEGLVVVDKTCVKVFAPPE